MSDWTQKPGSGLFVPGEPATNVFAEPMPTVTLEQVMATVSALGPPKRLRARGVHADDVHLLREWIRDAIAAAGGGVGLLFGPETIPIELSEHAVRGLVPLFWEVRTTNPDGTERWVSEKFIIVRLRPEEETSGVERLPAAAADPGRGDDAPGGG